MKRISLALLIFAILNSCTGGDKTPDISDIRVNLELRRFDQDFFGLDTNSLDADLTALQQKYPSFLGLYLNTIVGVSGPEQIKGFFQSYRPVYDSTQLLYRNLEPVRADIEQAFRYVKFYYPAYKLPETLIALVGPMNSREDMARTNNGEYTPNFIQPDLLGISLQFYLGADFSFYQDQYFINNVAPIYRSRRFAKVYITADVLKLIVDDLYPDNSNRLPLVEQMVEKGKQWWLLDRFLPGTPDTIKTGYTARQLSFCRENEGLIWSYIIGHENLDAIDPSTIQTYLGEAPFTQSIAPDVSPGNIGQWIGWQIVKKYAEKNPSKTTEEIMKAGPREIIEQAKYKPK